jgi:cyclohexanecarboxylate-CoA ligase
VHFDADNLAIRRPAMMAAGLWPDRTINDALDAAVASDPERLAITAVRIDGRGERSMTYAELAAAADRVAIGLHRLGVRAGDVVAVQLANWWEFTVTYLACARIGAVMNPLMHIFRERELAFMLAHGEASVAIIPSSFRGHDFPAMYAGLRAQLPALQHVVVVDDDGPDGFAARLSEPAWENEADSRRILTATRPAPDDVTQLIYTSGTTGEPKGVMHSSNTLFSNIGPYAERLGLGGDDVVLMASPMAHQTGFMYGLMMPVILGCRAVLLDVWDATRAVALIGDHRATFTMASTPFLADLTEQVADGPGAVPSLRTFLCAGAPIPGPLVERAQRVLEATIVSAWGMSENGAVTTTLLDDEPRRAVETDGCPLPGAEVKVVDASGREVPVGEPGRLLVRACSNFGGYLKRAHLNAIDDDGWFDTGDLARLDERGYIRITGRSKDVIIRGGENIPVVEIEGLLYRHPAVAQVAIVAVPDERLGERACAVIVPRRGATLTFDEMIDFLTGERIAKNYLPERLLVVDSMPTTPSGKIQKFKLRHLADAGLLDDPEPTGSPAVGPSSTG